MNRSLPSPYGRHLRGSQDEGLTDAAGRSHLTLRGFWVGAFLSFFLSIGAPYANMAMRATNMAFDFNTPGAIFLFLVLVGLLNTLFKLVARDFRLTVGLALLATGGFCGYWASRGAVDWYSPGFWFGAFLALSALWNVPVVQRGGTLALNRAELVLVYAMLLVVSALCTMGLTQQLLPALTGIFYYASPTNQWAEKLFPLFPSQRILVDDGTGNRGFYEGGALADIPYATWVEPLCWWALLLLSLYVAMVSTAVILRRQWVERERLAYPLTQLGVAIVQGERGTGLLNGFLKNGALWWGAALPLAYGSLKALHQYYPSLPNFGLIWSMPFIGQQNLQIWISFALVGFSYLISTQIAAGIWIFYLLSKVEAEFLALSGLKSTSKFVYGVSYEPLLAYQGGGALIAMVLLGLWTGRGHLRDVWRKARSRHADIDDGDEIMSYRAAVTGVTLRHRRRCRLAVADGHPALGRRALCGGSPIGIYRHLAGRVRGWPSGCALAHDRPRPHRARHWLADDRCGWRLQPLLCLHLVGRHPHLPAGHGRQWLEADPKHGPPQSASRVLGAGSGHLYRRGGILLDGLPPRLQVRGHQPR